MSLVFSCDKKRQRILLQIKIELEQSEEVQKNKVLAHLQKWLYGTSSVCQK